MSKTFHILNGDELLKKIPSSIIGKKYICRECFVDGNVQGENLNKLYKNRAFFLSSYFQDRNISLKDYEHVSNEFEKILNIPENAEINLWFEEDLFCQVNMWFVLYLLKLNNKSYSIYLILPDKKSRFSFGKMTNEALLDSYQNKIEVTPQEFNILSRFWNYYKSKNYEESLNAALSIGAKYSFIIDAIAAWKANRPKTSLKKILKESESKDFWTVFNKFKETEAIYGLGDLQVKRLLREIEEENS